MILMVPYSPEVPKAHTPMLWPALVLLLLLGVGFLRSYETIAADYEYVNELRATVVTDGSGHNQLAESTQKYLSKRPLLDLAPSQGNWDYKRLIYANFLHGSLPHLVLNWIGVFAGARICTTFIPFLCTLSIFILGGSLGLLTSIWLGTDASTFIPHIGASGGIFALMGAYYVYNFRFRTLYFFWFPSRHGTIHLRTSWFVFLDVLLLELVLSMGQFLPSRVDSVDHLAHVIGFASGVILALGLRFLQRWPSYVQTRAEFIAWDRAIKPAEGNLRGWVDLWTSLLEINPYNDALKQRLCGVMEKDAEALTPEERATIFSFFSPTFLRLETVAAAQATVGALRAGHAPPLPWLAATPYDSIIRLAQEIAKNADNHPALLQLILLYRRAHPEGGNVERKLEALVTKLSPPAEPLEIQSGQ
ncbi:rhomboid family intramembrane serine protease [bacterium]|nr:rhomboid family intramembrane serine protease [bacterium]